MLTQNVGGLDRIVRIMLGLVLIAVGFAVLSGTGGTIVGLVGLIPLVTGLIGWCPLYLPFRFRTNRA